MDRNILAPVSVGELLDKISILKIKSIKITNSQKLVNIQKELGLLLKTCEEQNINFEQNLHFKNLSDINLKLWVIEDKIRLKELENSFDQEFIDLARAVYLTNDKRFEAKSALNKDYGSGLIEEKSYQQYN